MVSRVTSKGQLTLPLAVRRQLGIRPGDQMKFIVRDNGRVEVVPVRGRLRDLRGTLPKPAKPVSLRRMEQAIRQGAA